MAFSFPKISGFFGAPTTATLGGKGGTQSILSRVSSALPTAGGVGNAIGTIAGGKIKQGLLGLGAKTFPKLFNNKYLGPLANNVWGSLFHSSSDDLTAMERRADPIMNIDWAIKMPDPEMNSLVESITFSTTGYETTPYVRAGRTITLASGRSTPAFSITFYMDVDNNAIQLVEEWKRLVGNADGSFNYPSEYRKPVAVNVVDASGQYTGTFLLANCFPQGSYQIENSSEGVQRQKLTQEFSTDAVVFVPAGITSTRPPERI